MKTRSSNSSNSDNNSDVFFCTKTLCSYFPLTALIPMSIVYIILWMVGVTGNIITILIIRKYKDMRTTTNFYLSSMAVSDMIILFCLPFDLYRLWKAKPWIFGEFMCKFFYFIGEGCTYSTILHITALSIERYLAICFPLKAKVFITKRRVKAIIFFLWVFASLSAGPFFFLAGMEAGNFTEPSETSWECNTTQYARESGLLKILVWMTTIYFFVPMFCLNILYGFIGRTLWKSKDRIREFDAADIEGRNHKQAVKIWAVVVLAFVICWLPFHIGRIIFIYASEQTLSLSQYFNIVAMLLFYLSAAINPILYNLISKKYRAAAYKLLRSDPAGERAYSVTRDDTGGYTDTSGSIQHDYVTNI
ncbi:motilin receptor [Rhinatrema bivittatum]|uniref:motilin receptor n=1 Tax=Rhinatrema bivittatum TaxID=194408 RepID=UPI0011270608|nr:motilin receptor [Rhinatrema bivittatum]